MSLITYIKKQIKKIWIKPPNRIHFLVVGAQKSGTTALDNYLRKHPDIGLANIKEVHYFDKPENFSVKTDYEVYHQYFNFKTPKVCYGEITPSYIYCREAPRRIYNYNPKIKIIAILRNPADRAYSQWQMNIRRKEEQFSFEEAIQADAERNKQTLPYQNLCYSYTERGIYSEQIRRYQRYFKDHQLLFIQFEKMVEEPENTLKRICHFLSVKYIDIPLEKKNDQTYPETMKPETRNKLLTFYKNDILETERLLGWNCSNWLNIEL